MINKTPSNGIGFAGLLTILFIGLKLGHVINWSWWWVLSPIWLSFAIGLLFTMIMVLFVIVQKWYD
jgi:membrane protein YdbS with pleckstrin-like domain